MLLRNQILFSTQVAHVIDPVIDPGITCGHTCRTMLDKYQIYRSYLFTLVGMLILIWFGYQHTSCFHEKLDNVTLLPVNSGARFACGHAKVEEECSLQHVFLITSMVQVPFNLKSRDIHPNPGPRKDRASTPKHPCGEYQQSVRNNQAAILFAECKIWFHAKCINMHGKTYFPVLLGELQS